MADYTECTGEIWEGDSLTTDCKCFKERAPIFKVDGTSGSVLQFASSGQNTLTQHESSKTIDPNPAGLKICRWKQRGLLRAGIKSNCADIGVDFVFSLGQIYPAELPFTLAAKRIRYRVKYADAVETVTFPFAGSWTYNQYILVGGVPTPQTPMTITVSDLTVSLSLEDPCIYSFDLWSASLSDDQATNDAWSQDPDSWDPSGSTFNNESVHADGRVGIGWRFYNTIARFGEVTYGPTVFGDFQKGIYTGDENTPYGFSVIHEEVNYP